jgi:isopentenyl-diphosphate delta-isomerase
MTDNSQELVVLVDEEDGELGVMEKGKVHHTKTPLHRAFSVFLFNKESKVLVTKRAKSKKTWGGVWTNSFCGHPVPGETYIQAIHRRAEEELGIMIYDLRKISNYRYRFERDGVVENELCPVYAAKTSEEPKPNKDEVGDYRWMGWEELLKTLKEDNRLYQDSGEAKWSEWCKEEAILVDRFGPKAHQPMAEIR